MSKQQSEKTQRGIRKFLPQMILLLFILQPIMDVVSYWLTALEMGTAITLVVRTAVLAVTVLLGFSLSRRKRAYLCLIGLLLLLAAGHACACSVTGYDNIFEDLANYIRVIQLPLVTFSFITFLRESEEDGYRMIECGFVVNFGIIVVVEILSTVTGTDPHTYANKSIGVLGWFYFANSQSAILSAMAPVLLMQAIRKKKIFVVAIGMVVSFGVLYLFATRLAYFAIFVCAVGLILVMLMCRAMDKRVAAILLAGAIVCGASYPVSPMYQNQLAQQKVAQQAQMEADNRIETAEETYHTTVQEDPEVCLLPVYEEYVGGMMERFGTTRVMQEYGYTSDVTELKDWRRMKIMYCSFLMEESAPLSYLFGAELYDMTWRERTYDVENDFHGIYFLYGIVGLALLLLFLLYFFWIICRALVADFSRYMTLEAGAFGIALCTLLLHVYCTAGVLRRPNASFYLSVVLAVIYYFVKIRRESTSRPRA